MQINPLESPDVINMNRLRSSNFEQNGSPPLRINNLTEVNEYSESEQRDSVSNNFGIQLHPNPMGDPKGLSKSYASPMFQPVGSSVDRRNTVTDVRNNAKSLDRFNPYRYFNRDEET